MKKLDNLVKQTKSDSHSVSREAEPIEEESPLWEVEEDETPMTSEEGESPVNVLTEDGSGGYEGSATDMTDLIFVPVESDTGSGDSWTEEGMELNRGNFLEKMS